jgi:hypothetical protein
MRLFAKGFLTGTQVQSIASAAWQDGWGRMSPLARKLAKPGVEHLDHGHIARDVVRLAREFGMMSTTAMPYTVALPDGKGSVWVMLPHEVYPGMAIDGLEPWCLNAADLASGPLGALLRTWAAHPDVGIHSDLLGEVAMLGIHCDGVSYSSSTRAGNSKKILVASWNVISARSSAAQNRRQPLFVLHGDRLCGCGCGGFHTYQALFEVLAWSLRCLAVGISPVCRHDSSPWTEDDEKNRAAGGSVIARAGLLQVRGDWEFIVQCFRFRWYTSEVFCWMCNATRSPGEMCFHNFSPAVFKTDSRYRTTPQIADMQNVRSQVS